MNILALDTSGTIASVAVYSQERLYTQHKEQGRSHSQFILPMIEKCLKEAKIHLNDIELCLYSKGPGSFTGLRLVCSVIQGLSFSLNWQICGFSTLQAIAQAYYTKYQIKDIIVCNDARMQEVYFNHFKLVGSTMESNAMEQCLKPKDVLQYIDTLTHKPLVVGSGMDEYPEFDSLKHPLCNLNFVLAPSLIHLSKSKTSFNPSRDLNSVLPAYIRIPHYKKKVSKQ